jgi:hypothetical protein
MKHSILNCPDCNKELTRVKRTSSDRLLNAVSFNRYYNKRYYCFSCLKSFAFNNSQLDNKQENISEPALEKIDKYSVPRSVIAVAMFCVIAALAVAGNYFTSKNKFSNTISSSYTESAESVSR